jgi:hypothetical protein
MNHLKQLQSAGQWPPQTTEQAEEILGTKKTKKTTATKKLAMN